MTEDQAAMTPEERLAANLCCECCADLTKINVDHHSATHWPAFIRPDGLNAEAIRRQELLRNYVAPTPPTPQGAKKDDAENSTSSIASKPSTSTQSPSNYESSSKS